MGVYTGIGITIKKAVEIIPVFMNISIDEQAINDALFRYHHNIGGGCIK